jgi:hypothetical protein
MSYKVFYKGLEVVCDTFEDLDTLAEKATTLRAAKTVAVTDNRNDVKPLTNGNANPTLFENSEPIQLQDFVKGLTKKTKLFLGLLAESGQTMSDTEIRERLGIDTKQKLLGTISAVYKGAARAKISIEDILIRTVTNSDARNKEFATQIPDKTLNTIRDALKD